MNLLQMMEHKAAPSMQAVEIQQFPISSNITQQNKVEQYMQILITLSHQKPLKATQQKKVELSMLAAVT